ncbi:MAG: hypothetical protein ACTTKL_07635 [Treponema sp.]
MTDVQKFHSDIRRSIKHSRAEKNGRYNVQEACEDIVHLFSHECEYTVPKTLAASVAEYWKKEYIDKADNANIDFVQDNLGKLGAMLAFLEGSDEDSELLTQNDWRALAELVNFEAGDMAVEVLQTLMNILISKNALD